MTTTRIVRMFRTILITRRQIPEVQSAEVTMEMVAATAADHLAGTTAEAEIATAAVHSAEAAVVVVAATAAAASVEAVVAVATAAVQAAVVAEAVASADVDNTRTSAFIIRCTSRIGHWA